MWIGRDQHSASYQEYFNGKIDELRFSKMARYTGQGLIDSDYPNPSSEFGIQTEGSTYGQLDEQVTANTTYQRYNYQHRSVKTYSFDGANDFIDAGASLVSFHPEASKHVHRSVSAIKDRGCKAGLVLNPATQVNVLEDVLEDLDLVLIMSVNPGFGGQSFIESSLKKVEKVRKMIDSSGKDIKLEIDGGINKDTIASAYSAGADTFVAGSAIFNSNNYEETISLFRKLAS